MTTRSMEQLLTTCMPAEINDASTRALDAFYEVLRKYEDAFDVHFADVSAWKHGMTLATEPENVRFARKHLACAVAVLAAALTRAPGDPK